MRPNIATVEPPVNPPIVSLQIKSALGYLSRCRGDLFEAFEFWLSGRYFLPDMEVKLRQGVRPVLGEAAA